ncbi:MAG TPA: N-6 DNA methylase [Thermoanaerobaculia bacterium]
MAVIEALGDPSSEVRACKELGAPVIFVAHRGEIQWWTQGAHQPEHRANLTEEELPAFFERNREQFAPLVLYRAKTRGRFEKEHQLSFVDAGLMNLVEGATGEALSRLVERVIVDTTKQLSPKTLAERRGQWLFQAVFWLLAAKILWDKRVPAFQDVDLTNLNQVFSLVANHYGAESLSIPPGPRRAALTEAAHTVKMFSNLGNVTAESLAYMYENALISKKTRSSLATHSTPGYLVDYIVWRLAPWIEQIPERERDVFEPACGHAAFLVAAMRLLRDLGSKPGAPPPRRPYLRERLHGLEIDPFALEIARLSLTLADVPNPDGWDLQKGDIFFPGEIEQRTARATVVLANPPFGAFGDSERNYYSQHGAPMVHSEKTAEVLRRTIPYLKPGAVLGFVTPRSVLDGRSTASLRRSLAGELELLEISLFPDQLFSFSDSEFAVLLARRPATRPETARTVLFKRLRERDAERFKEVYAFTTIREVPQERFLSNPKAEMVVPELEEVWSLLRFLPQLADLAEISKGLDYKGQDVLEGKATRSDYRFEGAVQGFTRVPRSLQIHQQPHLSWMSLDSNVIQTPRAGATTGVPQVLVNYAPVSRGPWCLKAFMDPEGRPVTSRFLTVRPRSEEHSLWFLWALCNSPIANAFVHTHATKRDVKVGTLRRIPVPRVTRTEAEGIEEAARAYFREMEGPSGELLTRLVDEETAKRLLLQIDAEILRLYRLPPRLERQLLDLFEGEQREGIPFQFNAYFPKHFEPCFPLHLYLSGEYRRSTADHLAALHRDVESPALLAALRNAVEAFETE